MKTVAVIKNRGRSGIKVTYTLVFTDDDGIEKRLCFRTKKQAEVYCDKMNAEKETQTPVRVSAINNSQWILAS